MSEVIDIDANTPHLVVKEKCRECGWVGIGVIPVSCPRDAMECGGCHRRTSAVTHYESGGVFKRRLEAV